MDKIWPIGDCNKTNVFYFSNWECWLIGMHLCRSLLKDNYNVVGFDNINNYYDKNLKRARLKKVKKYNNFYFRKYRYIQL